MLGVERGSKRLRSARRRLQDEQVLRRAHVEEKFPQGARERRERSRFLGGSSEWTVAFGGFYELQLAEIAREGSLGNAHADMSEAAPELILVRNRLAGDELQDLSLAESFVVAHDNRR